MARPSEVPTPEQPRRSAFDPLRAALGRAVGRLVGFPAQLAAAKEQGILEERQRQEVTRASLIPVSELEARIQALETAHQHELSQVRAEARLDGAQIAGRTAAHELNNAISPVTGYAELLSLHPKVLQDPILAGYARAISEAATDTTIRIAQFGRIVRLKEASLEMGRGKGSPVLDLEESTRPEPPAE